MPQPVRTASAPSRKRHAPRCLAAPSCPCSDRNQEITVMIKRRKNPNALPDGGFTGPFRHENHPRPVTRRELLGAGFLSGGAVILAPAWLGALLKISQAKAAGVLDTDLDALTGEC